MLRVVDMRSTGIDLPYRCPSTAWVNAACTVTGRPGPQLPGPNYSELSDPTAPSPARGGLQLAGTERQCHDAATLSQRQAGLMSYPQPGASWKGTRGRIPETIFGFRCSCSTSLLLICSYLSQARVISQGFCAHTHPNFWF